MSPAHSILQPSLLLIIGLVLSGCDNTPTTSHSAGMQDKRSHRVEASPIQYENLAQAVSTIGSLVPRQRINIHSQSEGRIDHLPYYPGDAVTKDQLIAQLDNRLIQADLQKTQAEVKQARYQLGQVQKLLKQQLVATERQIEAETTLEIKHAEQRRLQILLANTQIKAPFSGIITERLLEAGDIAKQHQHILSLVDPSSLYVKTQISEQFIPFLQKGDTVEVRIDALGTNYYPATISRIFPLINPQTLKATIEVQLKPLPAQVQIGQFCRINFEINPHQRTLIPLAALRSDEQGSFVFIINQQQKAQRVGVKDGIFFKNRVEILDGLTKDTVVITRGFLGLSDGMDVKEE